jgi:hypothetical protein
MFYIYQIKSSNSSQMKRITMLLSFIALALGCQQEPNSNYQLEKQSSNLEINAQELCEHKCKNAKLACWATALGNWAECIAPHANEELTLQDCYQNAALANNACYDNCGTLPPGEQMACYNGCDATESATQGSCDDASPNATACNDQQDEDNETCDADYEACKADCKEDELEEEDEELTER